MEKKGALEKHEFALFFERLPRELRQGEQFPIEDEELVHRMVHVLRMHAGEQVLFFSRETALLAEIADMQKRKISCIVKEKRSLAPLSPEISWYLPLVDREAFDASISVLTSLGAAFITPIITEKSSQKLHRSIDRLERVMIAAAEQSKQFVLPKINEVISLHEAVLSLKRMEGTTIFFDPEGNLAFNVMEMIREKGTNINFFVGPEADLSADEKNLLRENGAVFCALTPSILRVEQAILVGMGMVRSFCR